MTTATARETRRAWFFGGGDADGGGDMVDLLGTKGANLHEMSRLGLPVPPGFTLTTEVCRHVQRTGGFPDGLREEVAEQCGRVEELLGRGFGDAGNPLLFSVRSGAPLSMPGMMDTVLNIGLNDETIVGLEAQLGSERAALDSYRRFVQMYGNVVERIPGERYERAIEERKKRIGQHRDIDLGPEDWRAILEAFFEIYDDETGEPFPTDPMEQLWGSISAVFSSWSNPRAVKWRDLHDLPHDVGTAANVQAMVFGNTGDESATGVAFTRDPATGEKPAVGEFLVNAQGEDVVSGARTPHPLSEHQRDPSGGALSTLEEVMPGIHAELEEVFDTLERHYLDMQDIEFTVENGRLFVLQTRTGKRTATAMVKIAHDMAEEGLIDRETAIRRLDPERLEQLLHPSIADDAREDASPIAAGLGASPGGATGRAVFDPDRAEELAHDGERVILVRRETAADDIGGMAASEGVLTTRGGATSHAAVVARGMGTPCVAGCGALDISIRGRQFSVDGTTVREGDWLTIDGASGEVFLGELEMVPPKPSEEFATLMSWADGYRRLDVRANADTPDDAALAVDFGAEGIGLCRTEHMFFAADRIRAVHRMILLAPAVLRLRGRLRALRREQETAPRERRRELDEDASAVEERLAKIEPPYEEAIEALRPEQRSDFVGIFRAMDGRPVTIRLLDPPLHEFLPTDEEDIRGLADDLGMDVEEVEARIERLTEANPMLGHRGCRLGITYPEIYEMQVRAILEAAISVHEEGVAVKPEIMIPLVSTRAELAWLRERIERIADEELERADVSIRYRVGTMIELPRAAVAAGDIAEAADFFSFGTNDLTQTTFGISRDDARMFLDAYQEMGILPHDPFSILDRDGVGRLVRRACDEGRATKPGLGLGLCGEHGGEPSSVAFCDRIGLDYVSCSPYRVPVARLAAAQSALAGDGQSGSSTS